MGLFQSIPNVANAADTTRPLADRMRPRTLDEYAGQEHLIGPGKPLRSQIERDDKGWNIEYTRDQLGNVIKKAILIAKKSP